jgi:hypothetical protein
VCAGLRIATFPELNARESRSSSAYNFIKQMPTNFDRRSGYFSHVRGGDAEIASLASRVVVRAVVRDS